MSRLDDKLGAWREHTEAMQPSDELMASLASLAAAASVAPVAAPAAAGRLGALAKSFLVSVIGGAVIAGGVLAARALQGVPPGALFTLQPQVVVTTKKVALPAEPKRLVAATRGLPRTCEGQRRALAALVDREAGRDPDAAAAAIARISLLCRKDADAAYWPWALVPSKACDWMADPCPAGATVPESIANAERCLSAAPPGSCAHHAARLKATFAWCEQTLYGGATAPDAFKRLGEHAVFLGVELGKKTADAALWCQNVHAQAEPVRQQLTP